MLPLHCRVCLCMSGRCFAFHMMITFRPALFEDQSYQPNRSTSSHKQIHPNIPQVYRFNHVNNPLPTTTSFCAQIPLLRVAQSGGALAGVSNVQGDARGPDAAAPYARVTGNRLLSIVSRYRGRTVWDDRGPLWSTDSRSDLS